MLRTLDLFLLTLVRDGIKTPYEWQARASVSLGASLPAVKRLLEGRLVTEAEKKDPEDAESSKLPGPGGKYCRTSASISSKCWMNGRETSNRSCGLLAWQFPKAKLS